MDTSNGVENNQPQTTEQMLQEILKYTKKTHNYMKWQMYIVVILVVLPLLAMAFILPSVLSGLSGAYGGLLQ